MKTENPCLVAITVILDFGWVFDNKQDTGTVLDCFSIKHLSITKVKMGMSPWKNPGDTSFTRWSRITKRVKNILTYFVSLCDALWWWASFLSRMNSLNLDMRKGWTDPDWGACYSMKGPFKAGMVRTVRETLRNSSKLKEMKETWQVNAMKLCGLNPEKEGKKTFWIVREIWMRSVNYLVVLY